jgi:hypothetical protein
MAVDSPFERQKQPTKEEKKSAFVIRLWHLLRKRFQESQVEMDGR